MKTSILASLALALLAVPAMADDDDDRPGRGKGTPPGLIGKIDIDDDVEDIGKVVGSLNGQINLAPVNATLDATVADIGTVSLTAAAIGNSLSATGAGLGSLAGNGQLNLADITAKLDVTVGEAEDEVDDAKGQISATSAAIGNSVSLSVNGVQNKLGQVNTGAISSSATVAAGDAQSAVTATSAAIGNSLSLIGGVAN
jgi:hypothetical protein